MKKGANRRDAKKRQIHADAVQPFRRRIIAAVS
jgi:hypothetical protein